MNITWVRGDALVRYEKSGIRYIGNSQRPKTENLQLRSLFFYKTRDPPNNPKYIPKKKVIKMHIKHVCYTRYVDLVIFVHHSTSTRLPSWD